MLGKTKRRLLFSMTVIIAWFGLIVEGAHALYTDTATLAGNTITTGSTDLQISNSQAASTSTYADTRTGFTDSLSPGKSNEHYFFLKNTGTDDSLDLDVSLMNASGSQELAAAVLMQLTPVDSTGAVSAQGVAVTMDKLNHVKLPTSLAKGAYQRYVMRMLVSSSYVGRGQDYSFDLVFTGTQHVDS